MFQKVIKWPTETTLFASRKKALFMLAACFGFVAIAIFLRDEFDSIWMPLLCGGFFGLCGLVFVAQVLKPGHLIFKANGFEEKILGRTRIFLWHEVSSFLVMDMRNGLFKAAAFVSFSRLEESSGGKMKQAVLAIAGGSEILGDNYGMKTKELMVVMNAYREAALRQGSKLQRNLT